MSIANCPVCGKDPGTSGRIVDGVDVVENVACCNAWFGDRKEWNKYAVAVEFAAKAAWHAECEELNDWMGIGADSRGTYKSVFAIERTAADDAEAAYHRAVEVWNG